MNFHLWRARALRRLGGLAAVARACPPTPHRLALTAPWPPEARAPMPAASAPADGAHPLRSRRMPCLTETRSVSNLPINGPDSLSVTAISRMRKIGVMQDVPIPTSAARR